MVLSEVLELNNLGINECYNLKVLEHYNVVVVKRVWWVNTASQRIPISWWINIWKYSEGKY